VDILLGKKGKRLTGKVLACKFPRKGGLRQRASLMLEKITGVHNFGPLRGGNVVVATDQEPLGF